MILILSFFHMKKFITNKYNLINKLYFIYIYKIYAFIKNIFIYIHRNRIRIYINT